MMRILMMALAFLAVAMAGAFVDAEPPPEFG